MSERGIVGDYNVNKGGTAYMTPFADESQQRAFKMFANEECEAF